MQYILSYGIVVIAQNIVDFNPPEAGKDADKGGRSTIEEMPYSLNLAIST